MVQVNADISASSVGAVPPPPSSAPTSTAGSFGGHLQRAWPSHSESPSSQPTGNPAQAASSGSASTSGAQAAAQTPAASSAADDSQPLDSTTQTSKTNSSAATAPGTAQTASKAAASADSPAAAKSGSDSQTGTPIDNGASQIPTALLLSMPQAVVSPTTPAAKPAAGTGADDPVIGESAADGKSATQITSTLTLAAQAAAQAAAGASGLPVAGGAWGPTTRAAAAAAAGSDGAAALAATGLLPAYGQTVTNGYTQSIASNPAASSQAAAVSAVQSNASAMANAVVGMLESAPVAATTHTAATAAATATPVAASNGAAAAATAGTANNSSGQNPVAATNSATPTVSGAVDAAAAANRQNPATTGSSSAAAGANPTLSDGNRLRLVQRVARAFQSASANDGSIKLRLSPPELGSLRIEIKVDGGQMNARLDAETPAARDTLLENLPALRDRLQQQDIKVVRFDVGLLGQSPGGSPQTPHRDFDQGAPARRVSQPVNTTAAGDVTDTGSTSAPAAGSAGLDVVI